MNKRDGHARYRHHVRSHPKVGILADELVGNPDNTRD